MKRADVEKLVAEEIAKGPSAADAAFNDPNRRRLWHLAMSVRGNIGDTIREHGGTSVQEATTADFRHCGWTSFRQAVEAHQDTIRDMIRYEDREDPLLDDWSNTWAQIKAILGS